MCHINFTPPGCESLMKCICLSEHIPTSCVEPWLVLVGAWKSTKRELEQSTRLFKWPAHPRHGQEQNPCLGTDSG